MSDNVIRLPRPRGVRTGIAPLAFFVRVGHNDHKEMLDLMATGERGVFGFVIGAQDVGRHRDLIAEARRREYDVILDPKTQQMGLSGSNSEALASLPWGMDRHHVVSDFDGSAGRRRAAQIVEMATEHGFTQVLGPTHLLSGPNDPWIRRDIRMMGWVADEIGQSDLGLIYSLAIPMEILRRRAERQAVLSAVADAPCDAIWVKVENFGDDATGEKTAAYVEACRDLHERGVPVVGDHIGGLPGLGALAFGALGGMAHGVTVQQNFKASSWRRPRTSSGGGASRRVYIPQLDVLLKPDAAKALLDVSPRVRARCGCRDTHCCPHGVRDMIGRPARHAIYQRAREIEGLSAVPQSLRVQHYIEERVRRVSDGVAAIAGLGNLGEELQKVFAKKQGEVSRFRQAVAHLAESAATDSVALAPSRRVGGGESQ
ncbi:hypothetical protein [Magnetospirillum sp. UT-4]|uniref:hypothetical protein n=1 Tax=Magnetospirillum sp. UT-4 TaxID=2681467 RepID=UPI001383FE1B|nr:hypothetical protein [Magnetospirillum sp. UT-4]CAA7611937.1 conserved hypothetical protein [Magnetospirillum sp. UT-4]